MELDLDEAIIKTFDLEDMSADAQAANVNNLKNSVMQRVGIRLSSTLNEAELQQFIELVNSGHENEAFDLLVSKVDDLQKIVVEEIAELKKIQDDMFGGMQW